MTQIVPGENSRDPLAGTSDMEKRISDSVARGDFGDQTASDVKSLVDALDKDNAVRTTPSIDQAKNKLAQ